MLLQVIVGNNLLLLEEGVHLLLLLAQLVQELRRGKAVAHVVHHLLLDGWPFDVPVLPAFEHLFEHQNLRIDFEDLGVLPLHA